VIFNFYEFRKKSDEHKLEHICELERERYCEHQHEREHEHRHGHRHEDNLSVVSVSVIAPASENVPNMENPSYLHFAANPGCDPLWK
jgi:ABC-type Zn2+ transport system substrate-binding protein/surface adhesin